MLSFKLKDTRFNIFAVFKGRKTCNALDNVNMLNAVHWNNC